MDRPSERGGGWGDDVRGSMPVVIGGLLVDRVGCWSQITLSNSFSFGP